MRRFVLVALLLVGCERRLEVDQARLAAALDAQSNAALETLEVKRALDELWSGLDGKSLGKRGEALMAALGEDARVGAAAGRLMEKIGALPQLKAIVAQLMRANPRATPDEIGALVEKRISAVVDGPLFSRASDKAIGRLLKRPEIAGALDGFGRTVAHHPEVAKVTAAALAEVDFDRVWRQRLASLNGGKVPDRQRATELLSSEISSTGRLAGWYAKVYRLPVLKREVERALGRLLDAPSFRRATTTAVAAIVADAQVERGALDFMALAISAAPPSEEALERGLSAILDAPVVATALTNWLNAILADPALGAIGDDLIRALAAAPELKASFVGLVTPS